MQPDVGCATRAGWIAAFLDDELPAAERLRCEEHLRHCRCCTVALAEQRTARAAIRDLVAALHPPSTLAARLTARLDDVRPERRVGRRSAWPAAARLSGVAATLLVLVLIGAWRAAHPTVTAADLDRLVQAHEEETLSPNPVALVSADPIVVAVWARRQTGQEVEPPALDGEGYHLVGARAAPWLDPTAVSLVYEGPGGRLTCTMLAGRRAVYPGFAPAATAPLALTARRGTNVALWWDATSTYLMVGDVPPAVLLHLADVADQED